VTQTYTGNSPTWKLTGIVYLPNVYLDFRGAVSKSTSGYTCFLLVTDSMQISGTANIYANQTSQCGQAGATPPSNTLSTRITLVQ
jgi:hypothetical protein